MTPETPRFSEKADDLRPLNDRVKRVRTKITSALAFAAALTFTLPANALPASSINSDFNDFQGILNNTESNVWKSFNSYNFLRTPWKETEAKLKKIWQKTENESKISSQNALGAIHDFTSHMESILNELSENLKEDVEGLSQVTQKLIDKVPFNETETDHFLRLIRRYSLREESIRPILERNQNKDKWDREDYDAVVNQYCDFTHGISIILETISKMNDWYINALFSFSNMQDMNAEDKATIQSDGKFKSQFFLDLSKKMSNLEKTFRR